MSYLKKAVPYLISAGFVIAIIVGLKKLAPSVAQKLSL